MRALPRSQVRSVHREDYYALAGVFASTAYKEYPLVPEEEATAWKKAKEAVDAAEKALNGFLDEKSAALAERFATRDRGLHDRASDAGRSVAGLNAKVLERWKRTWPSPRRITRF